MNPVQLTRADKVAQLNVAFGNPEGELNKPDWQYIQGQSLLVLEEAVELVVAAFNQDMKELMDAQGDLTTVNDGVAHKAGFSAQLIYNIVHESNMSKFCRTAEILNETLQHYYGLGFPENALYVEGTPPQAAVKVGRDITVGGKFFPAGKFLKSVEFREPEFTHLFDQCVLEQKLDNNAGEVKLVELLQGLIETTMRDNNPAS